MAKQTAKIADELLSSIKEKQVNLIEITTSIGEMSLRLRELNKEIASVESFKKDLEEKWDVLNKEFTGILTNLNKDYPNGELDLNEGVVIFESAE